jgi:phosphoenolpyruvate carboxykinase (ATP)
MISGRVNRGFRLEDQGISGLGRVHYNLTEPALVDAAIRRGEGELGQGGALLVSTGEFTGRSPRDKFTVRTPTTEKTIWWDNNLAMSPEHFEQLHKDMLAYLAGREVFVQDLVAGADPEHSISVRLVNELAWHNLFIRHMLRRPDRAALDHFVADYTVINCTGFKADPERHGCRSETVIAVNIDARLILIGNTEYAGENKKSIFGLMNYLLPEKGVMPMHCSANHAKDDPEDTAVFFGLSGTGKTTLSADPNRTLLGDDEHGWSDKGTFNFEGGCYAKTIHLSPEAEPEIYATCSMFGTVIENMVYDAETRELDYEDALRLSAGLYPQRLGRGAGGASAQRGDADLRCVRRAAPHRAADACAGDVSFPFGIHRQDGRHRARPDRAAAGILDLLRRALHAAPPRGLRHPSARQDRAAWGVLLAGQFGLDGRGLWHRVADADQGHPRASDRGT